MGACFEDLDLRSLGGCIEGVPRCYGYFHSGGMEVRGGCAAEELINVEGRDWVFRVVRWWGHCWDDSGVLMVVVGGEGVKSGGDDVPGLLLHEDVAFCAEVFW